MKSDSSTATASNTGTDSITATDPSTATVDSHSESADVDFWPVVGPAILGVSVLMIVGITLAMAVAPNTTWIDGLGVGAFSAMWGGPGFGLMFGGAAWAIRQHKVDEQARDAGH